MQPSDFFTNSYKNTGKRPHSAKGKGPFSKKMDTRHSSDTRATEPATTKEVKFSDIRKMEQDYQKLTFRELAAEGKKHGVKVIPGYPMAKENAVMDITEARVGAKVYSKYLKHEDDKFHGRLGGGSGDQPRDEKGRFTFK